MTLREAIVTFVTAASVSAGSNRSDSVAAIQSCFLTARGGYPTCRSGRSSRWRLLDHGVAHRLGVRPAQLPGRLPRPAPQLTLESVALGEADAVGNLLDVQTRRLQQAQGGMSAFALQVLMRGDAMDQSEHAQEMKLGQA